jgi:curved DNA-binding protein CbpA
MESKANAAYKRLAQKYHPDSGGLDEQMQNLNKLKKQMLSLVKLNGGMGL